MLSTIISRYKLSQSAVVVENLLRVHAKGTASGQAPAQVANKLVQMVADTRPGLFAGVEGKRPHKLATAAAALAWGLRHMGEYPSDQRAMAVSLGEILLEITGKPQEYSFSGNDRTLFRVAEEQYLGFTGSSLGCQAGGQGSRECAD